MWTALYLSGPLSPMNLNTFLQFHRKWHQAKGVSFPSGCMLIKQYRHKDTTLAMCERQKINLASHIAIHM